MPDIKLTGKPMDQRISDRLKSSGSGAKPDVMVKKGDGPTRTITHIHHGSSQHGQRNTQGGPKGDGR
jgi:hypothetical protein